MPPPLATIHLDAGPADDKARLDHFLVQALPAMSRAKLQALIKDGEVHVDGVAITRPGAQLRSGNHIEVQPQPPPPSALEPADFPLDILYEDDDIVAVNKPAGLMVHPGAGERQVTLVNALLFRYKTLSQGAGAPDDDPATEDGAAAEVNVRPGIVHRLDRFTSGVIVVARNDEAHRHLGEQFQARTVGKTYFALVHGLMPASQGEMNEPIHRDLHHRMRMTTRRRGGREAHTSYTVRAAFGETPDTPVALRPLSRYSWLEVQIHTGRTHQIRVHLSAMGRPVVGDKLYGAPGTLVAPPALAGTVPERVMLHSARLKIIHPRTGAPMQFDAPLPQAIAELLERLRTGATPVAPLLHRRNQK